MNKNSQQSKQSVLMTDKDISPYEEIQTIMVSKDHQTILIDDHDGQNEKSSINDDSNQKPQQMLSSEQPHPYLYPQQRNEQCQSSRSLSPTTSSSSSKSLTNASRYHHQQLSTTLIGSKPDVVDPSSSSSSPAFAFSAPYERLAKFRLVPDLMLIFLNFNFVKNRNGAVI